VKLTGDEAEQVNSEVAGLIERVVNGNIYSSLQAACELKKVGAPAVGPLMDLLIDSGTIKARWRVAMALAKVGEPAIDDLITIVKMDDDSIKNPAVWVLAEIGDTRAVNPLIDTMRCSTTESCRALTAAALLKIGDPGGVAAVEDELLSGDDNLKVTIFEALNR
jgi:HEAT repeat protein